MTAKKAPTTPIGYDLSNKDVLVPLPSDHPSLHAEDEVDEIRLLWPYLGGKERGMLLSMVYAMQKEYLIPTTLEEQARLKALDAELAEETRKAFPAFYAKQAAEGK